MYSQYEAPPTAVAVSPFILLHNGDLVNGPRLYVDAGAAAEALLEHQEAFPFGQWSVVPYAAWLIMRASGARTTRDTTCWDLN